MTTSKPKTQDDFKAAFKNLEVAIDAMAEPLEQSPLAQSALHIEREGKTDYTMVNREYFDLLEAKAAAWDEAHRSAESEEAEEAALLDLMQKQAKASE